MTDAPREGAVGLRRELLDAIRLATDDLPWLRSVTLAGSFATGDSLDGVSDIDLIVVADRLDADRLHEMQSTCRNRLVAVLASYGWELFINMTLGPLKFDRDRLAVLHLMPYTVEGHIRHAIDSPFTCLDWQNAPIVYRRSLGEVYPVFGLQPSHFLSARRGLGDYLCDLRGGVVSWREIVGDSTDIREVARSKPMDERDRGEFGWHVLRFTMRNILKLLLRIDNPPSGDELPLLFFEHLPRGSDAIVPLYRRLAECKRTKDFSTAPDDLIDRLTTFLSDAEAGLRAIFDVESIRYVVVRHAKPEGLRTGPVRFLGRSDPGIAPETALGDVGSDIRRVVTSPLRRCVETAIGMGCEIAATDPRLIEIDYGRAEGMDYAELAETFPEIVEAWKRGEDPKFPGGESTGDVLHRVVDFLRDPSSNESAILVTHNVVIRCMLGLALNIPQAQWHRSSIPYATPFAFRWHPRYGLFVDLERALHRTIFADYERSYP